jgi:D-threo-aldose 1-dehydrogenase
MHKITFGDTGLSTTPIGYGCGSLMRPPTEAERHTLLTAAYDVGIRHFDIARYYGFGLAEGVLGRFISQTGCRDEITIATKFGLEPPAMAGSSRGRLLMNVARRVASIHPSVRKILSARANAGVKKNSFDVESARTSLDTSLRELQTDRIDLFLLHEASLEDSLTEGLLEFLENAKKAGKILAFGLGSDFPLVPPIIENNPAIAPVVQIVNGLGQWNRRKLEPSPQRVVNTHGALKILPTLEAAAKVATGDAADRWKSLGAPSGAALAELILGLALHDNPLGITLFSSNQADRIRRNVNGTLQHSKLSSGDWTDFEQAAETLLAGHSKP